MEVNSRITMARYPSAPGTKGMNQRCDSETAQAGELSAAAVVDSSG